MRNPFKRKTPQCTARCNAAQQLSYADINCFPDNVERLECFNMDDSRPCIYFHQKQPCGHTTLLIMETSRAGLDTFIHWYKKYGSKGKYKNTDFRLFGRGWE